MAARQWSPGELIVPGDLRRPRSALTAQAIPIENGDLEGSGGWTFPNGSISIVTNGSVAFNGTKIIYWQQALFGTHIFENDEIVPVVPGQTITCQLRYRRETNNSGRQGTAVGIRWLDASMATLSEEFTPENNTGATGVWYFVSGTFTAPAGAAHAQYIVSGRNNNDGGNHGLLWDSLSWDYIQQSIPDGLMFKAVQTNPGYTGTTEPVWPTVLGATVVDNEVTWEAVIASTVTWEAAPILMSGTVEPTWPLVVGAEVADGVMAWEAISRRIEDEKCPNTKAVAIGASKVFAADEDIISFCATVNPLDWSTADDAGYIPFGLQTYGANPVAALALYRSNLAAFNSQGFQLWQIDQDPANMAFLDAVPVGSEYPRALQPIANDLALLNRVGVRNLAVAAASTNLQAEGVGEPIDSLIKAEVAALADASDALGIFWPSAGQYWLVFDSTAYVLTINGTKSKSWSIYEFPEEITDATLLGNDLYLRMESDKVLKMDMDTLYDDSDGSTSTVTITIASPAVVSWTAHGLENGDPVVLSTTGELPTGLATGTTYYVVSAAANTFQLAATVGGSAINTSGEQSGTHTATSGVAFEGIIEWPFLDFGSRDDKQLEGIDLVSDAPAGVTFSIGYNQKDRTQRTAEHSLDEDTLTGTIVPVPMTAPSFSLRLTFAPGQSWEWFSSSMYTVD